jgi:hypothetical protein
MGAQSDQTREFLYSIDSNKIYRVKDRMLSFRYVVTDGVKERLFDNEAEVHEFFDRSKPVTL